jgi:hypothetical protein
LGISAFVENLSRAISGCRLRYFCLHCDRLQ